MAKVLLTGVAGFIGSHILEHILETTDWKVVGVASWQHKGTPERVEEVLAGNSTWRDRVTIITHDLNAPFTEYTKSRIGRIDYIINAASESHVDRSISDPVPFIQNNVNLVLNMLEFAREVEPKVFLQVSTDEVYGVAPEGVDHPEWDVILPSNPYSASKAAQEAICISYWRTYGVPLVITNTMNNFGEMQASEKYIAKIIRCIGRGERVPVHGRPGNIGSRYYLHARNHADAILFIVKNLIPKQYSEHELYPDRYNVVGDIELNNLEVVETISEIMGKPVDYELVDFHSTRPGHDSRYALDGTKLKELGWTPPVSFRDSMERYISWTLNHPIWL
jgi:dTDP-glucose 4,6-dehydratase